MIKEFSGNYFPERFPVFLKRCPENFENFNCIFRFAMAYAQKAYRLLRYSLTCTRICVRDVAQARPDEASCRLPAKQGGGGIANEKS